MQPLVLVKPTFPATAPIIMDLRMDEVADVIRAATRPEFHCLPVEDRRPHHRRVKREPPS
ncbi:hypothetical protein ACIBSV_30950 [Embleya sp. NPDC050154]|uniref:hypothetical protein n=1 Tax=Embleya sp. NPDC050154 TaxID=3363988 RepID=UPI0037B14CC8